MYFKSIMPIMVDLCPFLTTLDKRQTNKPPESLSIPLANSCFLVVVLLVSHEWSKLYEWSNKIKPNISHGFRICNGFPFVSVTA